MKKIAKLNTLPPEDQKLILALCEKHTYPDVAAIVAKPREQGGLALATNRSALSRFCQRNNWLAPNSELVRQFIDVLQAQVGAEDLLPHITRLMGQFTFLQMAQRNSFETCLNPINKYLQFERLSLQKAKWLHTQSGARSNSPAPKKFRKPIVRDVPSPVPPTRNPSPAPFAPNPPVNPIPVPKPHSHSQPQTKSQPQPLAPKPTSTLPISPVSSTPTLASFPTPKTSVKQPNTFDGSDPFAAVQIPATTSFISQPLTENPRNLTNLTQSHISTLRAPIQRLSSD